ncbi:MAG TPA: non-homologous end-joining DNA ligase [Acidimicrobiales bacterium]|nr:non-homologous end-joining DNA ligase [Acidimicrobiales bacterium]
MSDRGAGDASLERYRQMRDFERTAEPDGKALPERDGQAGASGDDPQSETVGDGAGGAGRFVVQEHAARRHHYDVRFEVDGVMASWAVPKGPSYDPKVRRLAVHVEDHPLDYRTFEGTIPKGEYGGGAVIVWDEGTYRNDSVDRGRPIGVRAAIDKGHLSVWLQGHKLRGGWSLVRTAGRADAERNWLMIKRRDDEVDPGRDVEADSPASVSTGRRLEEVAADTGGAQWTRAVATWRPPMQAELATPSGDRLLPGGTEWILERKLDGLRCMAVRNGADVALWSRRHLSYTKRFGALARSLGELAADNFVIDGEIVAFDDDGRTSFSLLQRPRQDTEAVYVAFDLLHLLGKDITELGVGERRALLAKVIVEGVAPGSVGLAESVEGEPGAALEAACSRGWEGLIAKRVASPYRSGRSPDWRKLKCSASQELVVGGWTDPRGARHGFGALLVGYHDGSGLRYAGKVGTGFDDATLARLHAQMQRLEQQRSPFVDPVREEGVHWITPDLVAAVAFTEWTTDGRLRHPRFEGLRDDKVASEVIRESPR